MNNEQRARAACEAHSTLNTFYSVIAILEGGGIYDGDAHATVGKIIRLCKAESAKQLRKYDAAMEGIKP